jgi:phage terminase large subunit-like protein
MTVILPRVRELDLGQRGRLLRLVNAVEGRAFDSDWSEWAHAGQRAPEGDWRTWVLMAGRGFGKTRAGSAWVHDVVREAERSGLGPVRIALVAATAEEARRVMVEGPSGLLATAAHPAETPRFEASLRRVVWPNGAEAVLFSGAHHDGLRGPEHHFAWCDELAKWRHPGETWAMMQLGLRAGDRPRALVTTTPRGGLEALKQILKGVGTIATGGASDANPHVAEAWLDAMASAYAGTRRGREEIEGLLAEDVEGALWPAAVIEDCRGEAPDVAGLVRVVIGVDPPASAGGTCGIVACGLGADGVGHVLGDHSASGLSPDGWARRVAAAAQAHGADRVVVETNQGGEMVRAVLRAADAGMPVLAVTARQGKIARAEPVAALFETRQVRLAGRFDALEAELAGMVTGGYAGPGRSPDRADAMVWALWALMLGRRGAPQVRTP